MKTRLFLTLIIAWCIGLPACTKESAEGPQGPQGEQGDPGDKGNPGPSGDDGEQGDVEVIISAWEKYNFTGSARAWQSEIIEEAVTQDILDKADITVYVKIDGAVYELNYFTNTHNISQAIVLGKIQLHSSFDASDHEFRYIIVPAGAKPGIMKDQKLHYSDYQKLYGFSN